MAFDLEKSLSCWRKALRRHKGFEEGDIAELEDHFRERFIDLCHQGLSEEAAFQQILDTDYANLQHLDHAYQGERAIGHNGMALFTNFLKVGLRSISRHSSYSMLNILGLTVGFAGVFGILIYLQQELSYDDFHENADDLYRVNLHFTRASGEIHYPIIPPAFGPELKANLPYVQNVARLRYAYPIIMRHEQTSFFEKKVFFAESAFLEMFSFPLTMGNPDEVLTAPNTAVITESMARKYFDTASPLGKVINYNNEIDLEVVGVMEDVPANSHFQFDFLISFETFKPGPGSLEPLTSWRWLGFLTYVQLQPGAEAEALQGMATELFMANNNSSNNRTVAVEIQPLKDIYLGSGGISNPQGGLFKINDPKNLRSLAIVAALIIIIAFFNYFNILAALMYTRTKEV